MATLGERIFNEGVDGNYWPLQVVQHCLATLSNLPLRIWARGRAEGSNENPLDHSIEEGLISHVNSRSFFEELLTGHLELVSRYMQRQHSGWLTVSCQAHPLWAYLRRNHLWLVREHCLLWNELGKRDPSDEKAISCFRTRLVGQGEEDRHIELMMSAAPLSDKFKPLFLVVGPLVVLPEEGASERSFRGAIENLVEEIFQVIPPTLQDNHDYSSVGSCVTKELLKPRFDRLVMAQYGCTSGWITETRLVSQARHIAKVLDAILKTDCTLLENCKGLVTSKDFISSSAFNALTQVVFSLFPQELLDSNPNARIEKFRDDLVHYFKIGIPSDGPSLPARNQVLKAERTKNKWSLTIVRDVDKNRPKAWVERKDKAPLKKGDAEYEQRLGFLRNDIGLLAANSNREHMGRRLSEFSDWIRRTYGIVSAGLGGSAGVGLALGDLLNRLKLPQLPLTERLGRAELRQELLLGGVRDARNACSAIVKLERIASQSLTEARKYLEDVLANASSASWPGISVKLNHSRSRRIWEKTLTVLEQLHTHSLEASESLPKFLDEIKDSQSEVVAFIKESDLQCRRERPDNLSCGDESQECYVFQGLHGRATQYQNQLVTLKKVVTEYQKFQSSLRGLIREISSKIKDEMGPSLLGKEVSDASGKNVDIRKDCVQNSVSGVTKVLSQMAELHEQHSKYLDQLLESEYAISTDRSYKPIAREICNLFNADAVVFYLRDFSGLEDHEPRSSDRFEKRLLTPRTMWFDDLRRSMPTGGGPEARSRKVRMTRRAMWNVGKIGNKKEISIAYRAAEERRGQICLAWLKNRKGRDVFDPEKPKILTHEQMLELANSGTLTDGDKAGVEDVLTGKTVIAVPLMVYDRVMGVLEIIGHYPYQFRRDTLLFAEQVGQMTSQFLYQREMLGRLLRITRVVCDPRKNEDQKFKEICRDMADILLADGAILFVPSLQTPGLFKRAASFNFKNMDDADDQREQPVDFDEEIEKSAEHRVFTEYSIKERREKWMKSPLKHRKEIAKQFPNGYAMVIHVWDPTRMVVLCRLSVYYEEDQKPSQWWETTVDFIASHLGLLVMAMRSLSPITGIGDASSKLEAFRSKLTAGSFGKLRDQIKALYEKHDPSRFLESRQADQLEKLADAYKEGSLVVVLGAGASKDYGLPAWDDLMLELHARTFDQDDPKKDKIDKPTRELLSALLLFFAPGNPVVFARQIMRRLGGEKHKRSEKIIQLSEILQEILYQKVKQPANSAYKVLARMLKTSPTDKGIHCIITYNYDNMLEREIENAGFYNCQPFWSDRDELDKTKKPVFHVHGYLPHSISLKSQPILAEDLYHEQYGTPYAWNNVVQLNKFSELTCLFIGCSFADPNLRRLMDIPRKLWKPKTTRHFLINKQQDDDEMPFHLGLALQRLAVLQSRRTEGWDRKLALKEAHEVQRQILRIVDAIGAEDLQEFGVETIWIKEYEEIPSILERIGGILGGRI